jgi:hypothetical protein
MSSTRYYWVPSASTDNVRGYLSLRVIPPPWILTILLPIQRLRLLKP